MMLTGPQKKLPKSSPMNTAEDIDALAVVLRLNVCPAQADRNPSRVISIASDINTRPQINNNLY